MRRILLLAVCAVLGHGIFDSASAQSPPFHQCPPIQQSPSCAILIIINPNGSLSFKSDPSVPPFDGNEDTLIGVLNKSGATVFGITLTGQGIFAFDGDGAGPNGGYAGPDVSFSVVDANNGTVNFVKGLTNGQSLWFSLEGSPQQVKLSQTITIDPGHGGTHCLNGENGTHSPAFGDTEEALALIIGLQLRGLFEANGDRVVITRTTATCPSIKERYKLANKEKTNIFVSLHFNGVANTSVKGTEVWYPPAKLSSQQLASDILDTVTSILGTAKLGLRRSGVDCPWCPAQKGTIGVLRETKMSSVLVEVAYLTNASDANLMHEDLVLSPNPFSETAQSIFSGILQFFTH